MFWTTVLSLHWEVRLRPFAFQLSGGNFVVEFGAVGRSSESSKHLLRFKFNRTQTVHFGTPESLFGLHGWQGSPCCRWGVPCFSVRQTKQVLKNVNEVQELRVLNQSWKCVMKSWYILPALIWHTCDNWPNPSPLQADYCTMFEICSRIEAHLVVGYSCPQICASGAHVWCHLDHMEGDSQWTSRFSSCVSEAKTFKLPRTACPRSGRECLSLQRIGPQKSSQKELQHIRCWTGYVMFSWVNDGGPLTYRASQHVSTRHDSDSSRRAWAAQHEAQELEWIWKCGLCQPS